MACSDDKCCGVTDAKPVAELRREAHDTVHEGLTDAWSECPHRQGECFGDECCQEHDGHEAIDALADRAEAAERAAEWHQRERESAVGERDKALERLTAAERERDEARQLHDEHCGAGTFFGTQPSPCTPPWRYRCSSC